MGESGKQCDSVYINAHRSSGAQSTHLPLPFPEAMRSITFGCEQVTAWTAVILGEQVRICKTGYTYLDLLRTIGKLCNVIALEFRMNTGKCRK